MLVLQKMSHAEPDYKVPKWSTGSSEDIAEALEKHYAGEIDLTEYWSIGDARIVHLSAMSATGVNESHAAQDITLVLSNVGGKYLSDGTTECAFQVDQKNCLNESGYMNATDTNVNGWKGSARRAWCNSVYYNAIPSDLRPIFKQFINQSSTGNGATSGVENTTDYFALRAVMELLPAGSYDSDYCVRDEGIQVEYYETTSNRVKYKNSSASNWWFRSATPNYNNMFTVQSTTYSSMMSLGASNTNIGIAPFGVI